MNDRRLPGLLVMEVAELSQE